MAVQIPLSGQSQWRVTPENPVRFGDRLDFERCAALHNELIQLGWTGSGKALDQLETLTWFEIWGEAAEESRSLLSEDLVSFLERAHNIKNEDAGSFFYYVDGLMSPERMWHTNELRNADEESPRYLTLYGAHDMPSHPDGLAFDLKTNKAIMSMSIHDTDITQNGRVPWYPLEVVLSAWLDMIDTGKVKAVSDELYDNWAPWTCLHWSDFQVEETANAFNLLIESIETRMRDQGLPVSTHSGPLLSESSLDEAAIPHGFARLFLAKAKRPQFRYIAPGLSVPDHESFMSQPFSYIEADDEDEDDEDEDEGDEDITIKPILLFRSSETFDPTSINYRADPFFISPFSQVRSYPAGLYLKESKRMMHHGFEDAVKLILPFGIGGNGFARTSDGLQIGDPQDQSDPSCGDRHADLYQQGWQPFIEMHDVRLVKVLESWIGMIQRGDWKVGEEGVEGTIEAFKEADTEQGWSKFVIPVSW